MATARLALSTVLDTVITGAGALNTTVGVVVDSVNTVGAIVKMGSAFIDLAAEDQRLRHLKHRATFEAQLADETTQELVVSREKTAEFKAKSPERAAAYDEEYTRVINMLRGPAKPRLSVVDAAE